MSELAAIDYAKYPYLADVRRFIEEHYPGLSFEAILERDNRVLARAFERIEQAVSQGRVGEPGTYTYVEEVLAYYASIILVSLSTSRWLADRYALAEAERSYLHMVGEPSETLVSLARLLGIKARHSTTSIRIFKTRRGGYIVRMYPYAIHFSDYLRLASRLTGDPSWKLVNQPLLGGWVYIDRKARFARLLKEAVQTRVREQIRLVEEVPPPLKPLADRVSEILSKYGRTPGRGVFPEAPGRVEPEAYPPCVAEIHAKALRGEHLSHHERFAIATFLLNIGASVDEVVDVFRNMPDFKEKIARYQVEHLAGLRGAGTKYRVYSCEKMKSLGICRADCGTRTPLSAYYRNLRRMRRKTEAVEG